MKTRQICAVLSLIAFSLAGPVAAQVLPDAAVDADYEVTNPAEVRLGQLLFYDAILSGNQNIACATCHHPTLGTADGVSLAIGDGGIGLGKDRVVDPDNPPEERIPRNAPALFNLGAREFTVMFHDGRLEADPDHPSGLRSPMDADMAAGVAAVLAAQTMFPVVSRE
ncbi:MAG: cytochrome-c peroxidase, partial [Octadecabacter sp.]